MEPRPLSLLTNLVNGMARRKATDLEKTLKWLKGTYGTDMLDFKKTNHGTMILFTDAGVKAGLGFNVMERGTLTPYMNPTLFYAAYTVLSTPHVE